MKEKLPNNYPAAKTRLLSTERKLGKVEKLGHLYTEIIWDYLKKGYVREVDPAKDKAVVRFYIPHFPVVKEQNVTTKVRIVFDASAKYRGMSLNDTLLPGPKLQNDIINVLLRFRKYAIAVASDVKEMYLQIHLREEDLSCVRFLWRDMKTDSPIREFEFTRWVFGLNASPFLAQYVSQQHAIKFEEQLPRAAETIRQSTYMDDSLDSTVNTKSAIQLYKDLNLLWGKLGMQVRKWASNSVDVLEHIPKADRLETLTVSDGERKTKALGITWLAAQDVFTFELTFGPVTTKRQLLRTVASVFDPLGFVTPVVVTGRILLQEVWLQGRAWDDRLETEHEERASKWIEELQQLKDLKIRRALLQGESQTHIEMHTFVDASAKAYGAVSYLLSRNKEQPEQVYVRLIMSKAKVAPLKLISIPRLELMGATEGVKMNIKIKQTLNIPNTRIHYWSDSINVLYWVRGYGKKFKAFVANRVSRIQEESVPQNWRHVPTRLNPADYISRGVKAEKLLTSETWWTGPAYLHEDVADWPEDKLQGLKRDESEDRKNPSCMVAMRVISTAESRLKPENYSDWLRLIRVTAWVMRFLLSCQGLATERSDQLNGD